MWNKWKCCSLGIKKYLKTSTQWEITKAPAGIELGMYGSQALHFIHSAME